MDKIMGSEYSLKDTNLTNDDSMYLQAKRKQAPESTNILFTNIPLKDPYLHSKKDISSMNIYEKVKTLSHFPPPSNGLLFSGLAYERIVLARHSDKVYEKQQENMEKAKSLSDSKLSLAPVQVGKSELRGLLHLLWVKQWLVIVKIVKYLSMLRLRYRYFALTSLKRLFLPIFHRFLFSWRKRRINILKRREIGSCISKLTITDLEPLSPFKGWPTKYLTQALQSLHYFGTVSGRFLAEDTVSNALYILYSGTIRRSKNMYGIHYSNLNHKHPVNSNFFSQTFSERGFCSGTLSVMDGSLCQFSYSGSEKDHAILFFLPAMLYRSLVQKISSEDSSFADIYHAELRSLYIHEASITSRPFPIALQSFAMNDWLICWNEDVLNELCCILTPHCVLAGEVMYSSTSCKLSSTIEGGLSNDVIFIGCGLGICTIEFEFNDFEMKEELNQIIHPVFISEVSSASSLVNIQSRVYNTYVGPWFCASDFFCDFSRSVEIVALTNSVVWSITPDRLKSFFLEYSEVFSASFRGVTKLRSSLMHHDPDFLVSILKNDPLFRECFPLNILELMVESAAPLFIQHGTTVGCNYSSSHSATIPPIILIIKGIVILNGNQHELTFIENNLESPMINQLISNVKLPPGSVLNAIPAVMRQFWDRPYYYVADDENVQAYIIEPFAIIESIIRGCKENSTKMKDFYKHVHLYCEQQQLSITYTPFTIPS